MDAQTQTAFDTFLTMLDSDRDQAGEVYERLRARLVKFFEWRNCTRPEELADIVFDRVVKKVAAGEQILNVSAYSVTVAQFVLKEDYRDRERNTASIDDHPEIAHRSAAIEANKEQNIHITCLDRCLNEFSPGDHRLIIDYHDTDGKTMIPARKRLAEKMGISLNTLRIRVCRLKSTLEKCTLDCCRSNNI